jgi:hypothetical protein
MPHPFSLLLSALTLVTSLLYRVAKRSLFTEATMNANVLQAQYAVRGALVQRAELLDGKLKSGPASALPFDEIIYCNIGNPQQLQQPPLTFLRQVRVEEEEKRPFCFVLCRFRPLSPAPRSRF